MPLAEPTVTQFWDIVPDTLLSARSTLTLQDAPAANVPPVSVTLEAPPVAAAVPPQPLFMAFGVAATTIPDGKVSVKISPVELLPGGLLIAIVIVTVPPTATVPLLKVLDTVGGAAAVPTAVAGQNPASWSWTKVPVVWL